MLAAKYLVIENGLCSMSDLGVDHFVFFYFESEKVKAFVQLPNSLAPKISLFCWYFRFFGLREL